MLANIYYTNFETNTTTTTLIDFEKNARDVDFQVTTIISAFLLSKCFIDICVCDTRENHYHIVFNSNDNFVVTNHYTIDNQRYSDKFKFYSFADIIHFLTVEFIECLVSID